MDAGSQNSEHLNQPDEGANHPEGRRRLAHPLQNLLASLVPARRGANVVFQHHANAVYFYSVNTL